MRIFLRMSPPTFGTRLRAARKAKSLRQLDLGAQVARSQPAVCRWERDLDVPPPSVRIVLAELLEAPELADALDGR